MCVIWWYGSAIIKPILLTFQLLFLRIIRMAYNPVSIFSVPWVALVALGELGCVYVWVCARAHMNTYAGMVGEVGHMGHKQFITWGKQFRASSLRPLRPVCSVPWRIKVNDDDKVLIVMTISACSSVRVGWRRGGWEWVCEVQGSELWGGVRVVEIN